MVERHRLQQSIFKTNQNPNLNAGPNAIPNTNPNLNPNLRFEHNLSLNHLSLDEIKPRATVDHCNDLWEHELHLGGAVW